MKRGGSTLSLEYLGGWNLHKIMEKMGKTSPLPVVATDTDEQLAVFQLEPPAGTNEWSLVLVGGSNQD